MATAFEEGENAYASFLYKEGTEPYLAGGIRDGDGKVCET